MERPRITDLYDALVLYPPGSRGEEHDKKMIRELLGLCEMHGFGRVPQVANAIEEIWRDPERLEHYKKLKESHQKLLAADKEELKRLEGREGEPDG